MKMSSGRLVSAVVAALGLIVAITLIGHASSGSRVQDQRNFWLLNNTGKRISSFFVSPHESDHWGQDILGRAELPNGIGTIISFDSDIKSSCNMDFKLVFSDKSEQTYVTGRNVCTLAAIQFNKSTSTGLLFPD